MGLRITATCLAATLLTSVGASAHTSYLLPTVFNTTEGTYVTLQSSFTDVFPTPEIAVISKDYHLVRPNGERDEFDAVSEFRQLVLLENALEEAGTYRFTTGVRLGRISKSALVDGEWKPIFGPDAEVPENATEVKTSQTETVADVYVSKGAPNWTPVEQKIGLLTLTPGTHPNEIYLGDDLVFDVAFGDTALADQTLYLTREGGDYEEPKYGLEIVTDADGKATINVDQPGLYLLMTRHKADAPDGAETDVRSYTTSITFEVLR